MGAANNGDGKDYLDGLGGRRLRKIPGGVGVLWIPRTENQDADALACAAVGMPQAPITPGGTMVAWRPVEMRDGPEFPPVPNPLAERLRTLRENPNPGLSELPRTACGRTG